MRPLGLVLGLTTIALAGALSGCRGDVSEDPPLLPMRNMYDQERYNPQSYSRFFPDHRTMRQPVEGTFAHVADPEEARYLDTPEVSTGMSADGQSYVMSIPQVVVDRAGGLDAMLDRGKQRYAIYCVPCHSKIGDGKGMVNIRSSGSMAPPTFIDDQRRNMPDGQIFATITRGKGNMPPYAAQIPVSDRWAIISYVRALQVSLMAMQQPEQRQK